MHPAASVIGFTVSSGAGYGMLAVIGLVASIGHLPPDWITGLVSMFVAVSLVTGGLLSSTFHLGHPERAWRAFSQWRSSWLSREGVAAVLTYIPAVVVGWLWVIEGAVNAELLRFAGSALFFMSIATVHCTAMIYRSLQPIPAWCNGFTVPGYLLMAAGSGSLLTAAVFAVTGMASMLLTLIAAVFMLAALVHKLLYWRAMKNDSFRLPSRESATGLTLAGQVRPLEDPHSSDNYLMKEMGFRVGRKHANKLRKIALIVGFVVPSILALAAVITPIPLNSALILGLASLMMIIGLLAERWLFFAEAKHAVTLYYRDRSA